MNALGSTAARRWISAGDACQILGCSRDRLASFVQAGHLTKRTLPDAWPTYDANEVEAFAERYTTPAKATA